MKLHETIKDLYDKAVDINATEAHIILGDKYNPNMRAVVSVYIDQRPSHNILDELYQWADSRGLVEVVEKITELSDLNQE